MLDGNMEGMFLMGQNPAVGAPNSRLQRKALSKLKWLVVREMVEIESANFWRESPEVERGELKSEDIETEIFFFPAAGYAEKEGAFTNTQRLLQWREKAVDPPGDCRSDAWFMHQLGFARNCQSASIKRSARRAAARAGLVVPRKITWAIRKWKPCSPRSTAGTPSRKKKTPNAHLSAVARL